MKKASALLIVISLLLGLSACAGKSSAPDTSLEYNGLFDTKVVHTVDVEISEEDWEDLRANPTAKTKYKVNVTIDGTRIENVSFATKGNTSLTQVAASDSDRYSFKINFGKYADDQTYYGLDKLNLNNIMSDATYMKDYLSYTIMREAGVNAPLISYASLSINGEVFGLYAAIENVSDSFLERYYGNDDGALYKPETDRLDMEGIKTPGEGQAPEQGGQAMPTGDPDSSSFGQGGSAMPTGDPDSSSFGQGGSAMPTGDPDSSSFGQGGSAMPTGDPGSFGQGGFDPVADLPFRIDGGDAAGADLVYKDDDPASYSAIFDNEENKVTADDEAELIEAIKALSTGEEIDAHWDMDQVIRYFAAHNFVLNYDSYTGTMLHNYYLYEDGGKVSVIPWDYNLAFGGFMGANDAVSAVNAPIDEPLNGATEDARPLWKIIVSNEEYLELYHKYFSELISSFFESGKCAEEIDRVSGMIASYVKNDPSAFYTYDQFTAAVETLKSFVSLRAESIRKQLDGKLGTTSAEQKAEDKVEASGLDLSVMGTQGGGAGQGTPGQQQFPGCPGGQQGMPQPPSGMPDQSGMPQPPSGMPDQSGMPQPPSGMPDQSGMPQPPSGMPDQSGMPQPPSGDPPSGGNP